jgi:hypothetical protein
MTGTAISVAVPSVQAAVEAAAESDQIWVAASTYTENLFISKAVTLYGG